MNSVQISGTRYTHPVSQRLVCGNCGKHYVLRTAILPDNVQGRCQDCGQPVRSLGPIAPSLT
jgi:hypothetical protein